MPGDHARDWSAAVAQLDRIAGGPPRETFSPRRAGALDQVRLYAIEQPPHWHVITLGLSDLGFELTLRLDQVESGLPTWAVDLLTSLAGYARRTGHPFANGHHIDLRCGADGAALEYVLLTSSRTPALGHSVTPSLAS